MKKEEKKNEEKNGDGDALLVVSRRGKNRGLRRGEGGEAAGRPRRGKVSGWRGQRGPKRPVWTRDGAARTAIAIGAMRAWGREVVREREGRLS